MVTATQTKVDPPTPPSSVGGPTWAVAGRFPTQGAWDDVDYFALDDEYPRFELIDGALVELPTPTELHQDLMEWLVEKLKAHLGRHHARTSGYKLCIRDRIPRQRNDYRYPDAIATLDRRGFERQFTTAADLVVEVMSPGTDNRERDLEEKRRDYAEAGVAEYWVVDPDARTVLQLCLADGRYEEVGTFGVDATLTSTVIPDFTIDLAEMFDGGAEG